MNFKKIKVAEKNLKPKPVSGSNSRIIERISIPPEKSNNKRTEITYYTMENYKIPKLLNDSTVCGNKMD